MGKALLKNMRITNAKIRLHVLVLCLSCALDNVDNIDGHIKEHLLFAYVRPNIFHGIICIPILDSIYISSFHFKSSISMFRRGEQNCIEHCNIMRKFMLMSATI